MHRILLFFPILLVALFSSCKKDDPIKPVVDPDPIVDPVIPPRTVYTILNIIDTYPDVVAFSNWRNWGPYNVHDPSVLKDGDYFIHIRQTQCMVWLC